MKPHYLSDLFAPKSIALIGASDRAGSIGEAIMTNLLANHYKGKLYPVNRKHKMVAGMAVFERIRDIDASIDLAVVATPIESWARIIRSCGHKKIRFVLFARDFRQNEAHNHIIIETCFALAKRYGIRILGPSVFGLMRPLIGLNATNFNRSVKQGNLALVSQSSALCVSMLDWADGKNIGFSSVISLGQGSDIDFGEVLDYLAGDSQTQGILLHVHHVHDARRFMSALRAIARTKPVVVIKSGRGEADDEGVMMSSRLIDPFDVFDVALSRAGVLRVNNLNELFVSAKALAANYRTAGNRLAIISNGIGPAILAKDSALMSNIKMAKLSPHSIATLNDILPADWSHGNPIDLIGDASPARFRSAVQVCIDDPQVDGVLVVFSPQAGTDHEQTAKLMIDLQTKTKKTLLFSWLGDSKVSSSRALFEQSKSVHLRAPEFATELFKNLAQYHQNQLSLLQTPGPLATEHQVPDYASVRLIIQNALERKQSVLSERDSKEILHAFHIPVNKVHLTRNEDDAVAVANVVGYPVVLKIDSQDIVYKSDVGGVQLNIVNETSLREAYRRILAGALQKQPEARIDGVTVQAMRNKSNAREALVGVSTDETFGPVIHFGTGGVTAEALDDRAVSLPPLNEFLVEQLIAKTRLSKLLGPFKNLPAIDRASLTRVLLSISELICEFPEIHDLEVNPLLVDEHGVLVLDARIAIAPRLVRWRYAHMAIMPYPSHMVKQARLRSGAVVNIRPIRSEDAQMQQEFVQNLSEESRYNRYLSSIKQLSQNTLARFTQLDYDREMALVMCVEHGYHEEMLAVARYVTDPDQESCEFALEVSDSWQHQGIGPMMMEALFASAKEQGLKNMHGEVLAANKGMIKLMRKLEFQVSTHPEDRSLMWVNKALNTES